MSIFQSTLPKEWLWACVGDFYAVTKKPRSLNLSVFEKIPFSPMDCIPQGGQFDLRYTHKPAEEIKSGTYFEHGDVLVGKITPCFENGKQALAINLSAPFGYATTEVIPLHPKDNHQDRRVLFYYLLHPDVRSHITEKMEGATGRQRVPENVLLELPFPKISFTEQEKIGAILLTVQQAIQCEAAGFDNAQELKRAAMREVFTRGLRGEAQKQTEIGLVPESWTCCPIGEIFNIVQGLSLKGNLSDNKEGYVFLRTSNVYWGRIEMAKISRMNVSNKTIGERTLRKGDLLVCEGGDIGRAAVWDAEIDHCTFQNHLHRLRPIKQETIHPRFAMAWLEEGFVHRQVYEGAGNKTTIPNLSRSRLAELKMPLPSWEAQTQIVTLLSAIDDKITLHKRKKAALEALFTSLLHQLMTGKIRVADLDLSSLNAPQTEAA